MSIAAGQLNATLDHPQMDLRFLVQLARESSTTGPGIQPKASWTNPLYTRVPCDGAPIKDDLYFAQSGAENVSQIIFHFYYLQDVQENDRVQFIDIAPPVGMDGAWFQIQQVFRPRNVLQYLRAYGRVIDAPGKG